MSTTMAAAIEGVLDFFFAASAALDGSTKLPQE